MPQLNSEVKDQLAVAIDDPSNGLVVIGDKKTEAIRIILACVGGPHEGHTIEWLGWLTDAAFEHTLKRLQDAFNFSGNFAEIAEIPSLFTGGQCRITTEFETDTKGKSRLKVKWLNAVDGAPAGAAPLDTSAAKSLASRLTARAKALTKAAGTKPPVPAAGSAPAKSTGDHTWSADDEIPS